MIRVSDVKAYIKLKHRIANYIRSPGSGFQPSRRELSEGLARSLSIDGENWTYSPEDNGYSFSNPRKRFSVHVSDNDDANTVVQSKELTRYLQCYTTHENLNELVVDNWLARACSEGHIEEVNRPVYGFRVVS